MADPAHRLDFDYVFPYIGTDLDPRPLPRLRIYLNRLGSSRPDARLRPLIDSGADQTAFDGVTALHLGWTEQDIVARAEAVMPIYGLGTGQRALVGYRHRVTCLIPLGAQFASVELRAFFTLPNTLSTPVLGRRDFLRQVDFALVEAEQRFYLRFRDRSALHHSWGD